MEFTRANPSIVRSVKQRDLLNAWLRAFGKGRTLPALADYRPERIADELVDNKPTRSPSQPPRS